ncbi:LysR family transcriptional regulator [Pediococcus stilesii]|uniref:Transcription regulator n=1 Tax=Pediococcus stilesii TaxID=331679 RepID=A0A0R2L0H3_9LACO|nr:LysR family transcriptional regulator [Pediococcus stilesii]KRN95166.1 transcription regulator [Pediococcus stilesii]
MGSKQEKIFSSKTLTYFLQLSDTMNYTQAAQILGITQPALTQQIKKLERAIGTPLFYSVGKKLRLTDAGYTMLSASHEINRVLNNATDEIQQSSSAGQGEISIGILASIETRVFEDFIASYFKKEPGVKIIVHMLTRKEIWENLENNQIDLAIMYLPDDSIKNWKPYQSRKIISENLLFIHHDEKIAKQKRIKLQRTTNYDWVTYPAGFYLDGVIREAYKNALVDNPNSIACFTTPDQIRRFADSTGVATALPESYVVTHKCRPGTFVSKFDPVITFDLDFVFRKDKDSIPRINNFLTEFNQYLEEKGYTDRLEEMITNKS